MIIADVCEFYSPHGGGVRTYIEQKFAVARECDVVLHVIAPGPQRRDEPRDGGCVHWVAAPHERFDAHYHRFDEAAPVYALLHALAPDVIEASSPWRGATLVAQYKGKSLKSWFLHMDPVAVYPNTFLYPALAERWIDRLAFPLWRRLRWLDAQFDTSIVASRTVAQRLAQRGMRMPQVIPLGIERGLFDAALPNAAMRLSMLRDCGFDDPSVPLLIAVARHHPEKRLALLMQAVAQFNARAPLALFMVGDGPWRRRVAAQASASHGVHLAGAIRDRERLASMMASADALLHGGAAETFGIAVAEALCAGLPVIVPDRGGANDFGDLPHGFRYATGDRASLLAAINDCLPVAAARRGDARQAAEQLFTPTRHLAALRDHYRQRLDQRVS